MFTAHTTVQTPIYHIILLPVLIMPLVLNIQWSFFTVAPNLGILSHLIDDLRNASSLFAYHELIMFGEWHHILPSLLGILNLQNGIPTEVKFMFYFRRTAIHRCFISVSYHHILAPWETTTLSSSTNTLSPASPIKPSTLHILINKAFKA
jgi:hypothetical protein